MEENGGIGCSRTIIMKKKATIFWFILTGCCILSCKKEVRNIYNIPTLDSSRISITNISPSISDLRVYFNNKLISLPDSPIIYGKTISATYITNSTTYFPDTISIPYINISPGYEQLSFSSVGNNDLLGLMNSNFEKGSSYSLFLTDTLVHGSVTSVLLKDNFLVKDTSKSQIRFLNLSADSPPLDVWAYPDAGYSGYKLFSACAYIPHDYNSFVKAESFISVDPGIYYFEATISGTSIVVLGGYLVIDPKKIISIYTKGYLMGTGAKAMDVGVIQYSPEQ